MLHELATDAVFTAEERAAHDGRATRVMRVRRVVAADSPTAAAWIETSAAAVDSTYQLLTADRGGGARLLEPVAEGEAGVLGAAIGVVHETALLRLAASEPSRARS